MRMPTNGYESGKTNGVICRLRVGPASSRICDRYAGSSANGIPQRTVSVGSEVSQPSHDDSPCARVALQPEGFVTSCRTPGQCLMPAKLQAGFFTIGIVQTGRIAGTSRFVGW